MELRQIRGPFHQGERVTMEPTYGYTYAQIGIQIPHRQPIAVPQTYLTSDNKITVIVEDTWREPKRYTDNTYTTLGGLMISPDVRINGKEYVINQCDILEFDELEAESFTIEFLKELPAETIFDFCFRGRGE